MLDSSSITHLFQLRQGLEKMPGRRLAGFVRFGLASLILVSLLALSLTPASASDAPVKLYDGVPGAFYKTSPANSATNQPTSLTLDWGDSKWAVDYRYCIDSDLSSGHVGVCDASWISTGLNTFVDLTGLTSGTTYEWQVWAHNTKGDAYADVNTWFTFTTAVAPPGDFNKSTPANNATGQAVSLTLSWSASSGATSYEYCYDATLDNDCTGPATWTTILSEYTSVGISGLSNSTQYEWQVRAVNSNPTMTYADTNTWWHFTTIAGPPGSFSKSSPTNGTTGLTKNLSLIWEASSDATGYEYCWDTTVDSTCPGDVWTYTELLYVNITAPDFEDTYEWQVRAVNANPTKTNANGGTWWTFTTMADPGGLYKMHPGDASTNQQATNLMLEWSDYVIPTNHFEYCVDSYIDNTCGTGGTGIWVNNDQNHIAYVDLSYSTQYEWQVRSIDSSTVYADDGDWWTFTTWEAPPGSFSKSSPANGATGQDLIPTLVWGASSGALSYKYCIDDVLNTTCDTVWNSTTDTSVDVSGLNYDTQYYWQVRAYNDNPNYTTANSGTWYTFRTIVSPPGNFNKTAPANGAVNQLTSLILSWGISSDADGYEYCINDTLDSICDGDAWVSTGTLRSVDLTGQLDYDTSYEWQVRATNANPLVTYANINTWWTFTTVIEQPGSFGKISPVHTAANLLPSSVTLQWGTSERAASYWYCVDSTLNNSCNGSWVFNEINTSAIPTDLLFATTYEWQIRADNANTTKTYADGNTWWTFTTRAGSMPGAFTKLFPLDTSIDQATNPILQWTASSLATRYEYCYDSNLTTGHVNFCDGTWISNGLSTQVTPGSLALNTQYEWQVRSYNDTVGPTYANSGSWWTFKTVAVDPPAAFGKTSPANGATGQPLSLTLTWGAGTNVDTLEYCIDNHPTGSCDSGWVTLPSSATSVPISGLSYGNTYEWQVRAYRNLNPNPTLADGGTWWTFSTVVASPGGFNKSEPINNAIDRPNALTLSWGISSGASYYEYCYEVYDGNDTCQGSWSVTDNNSADISGLNNATTYSWQVRSYNDNPTKTYANSGVWYQFTTIIEAPVNFSKSSPSNGASAQPLTLNLTWNASDRATSYAYCYDAVIDSSCSGSWVSTTATSATISGLSYSTSYQWQVRASNLGGTVYANTGTLWTFTTAAPPPGAFNKLTPAKGVSGQPINLTLTWGASSGASNYEYCIDTTLDSICDGDVWVPTAGLTSANPAGLAYLTTYQWQVRAINSNPNPTYASSGTWWIFTTVISPPSPFDKLSPGDEVINQPSSQYLTWQPSSGATGYVYCLDTTLDDICDGDVWKPTALLYANEAGLIYGATYQWQVRANNVNGSTDANDGETPEWWTFTVEPEPLAFSKANPNRQAINQPIEMTLTWTNVSDATGYVYCYDTTINATCDGSWSTPTALLRADLSLVNGTEYEWQVIAQTPGGDKPANDGETPVWWTFTTVQSAPQAFSKSNPLNGVVAQTANGLTLSWAASSGALGYRYCIDTNTTNNTCDTSWTAVGAGTTSVLLSNLGYSTSYAWQVLASNNNPDMTAANAGESPEWWTFTTAMAPPEAFNKLSPVPDAYDQLLNLTLSWGAAIGTVEYKYCLDMDLSSGHAGVCDSSWISTGTNTSVQPAGLVFDTVYEWQVQAFSDNPYEPTRADGGTWRVFTTVVSPPAPFNKDDPVSGLIDLPVNLMISWEPSAGATGYEYCIDSNTAIPGCNGVWIATTSTQAIITGLTNQTDYEWHVRAVNANPVITESNSGNWFTFSTIPLFTYLPCVVSPRLSAPVLNPVTVGSVGSDYYRLTWNAVTRATSYKIWESTTTTFPVDPAYTTTSTGYTLPALPTTGKNPTRYYYYVVAYETPTNFSLPSNMLAVDRQYELEENDTSQTSNGPLFFNVTYYFQPQDLKDFFKIYLPGPGTITVTILGYRTSPLWPGQLQLFEDNTGQLRAWDVRPDVNGMTVTWTGTQANWYYILIGTDPAWTTYKTDWYNFKVTFTPTP